MNSSLVDNETINIVGICGSLRNISYTRMTVSIALEGARKIGAITELIDLRNYSIGFCDGGQSPDGPDVIKLKKIMKNAHGFILGTPEYHGSFSGVLKNFLDFMGFEEFQSKVIGLVGVSGGSLGATSSLNGLRTVGRWLRSWVIPEQVSIPNARSKFNEDGHLLDPEMENRLNSIGKQVTRFALLHHSDKALEFVKLWENSHLNPGA